MSNFSHCTELGALPARPGVRPLFAGYVFGRFDVTKRLPVLMIPGVFNIVNSGGVPIALDEKEVTSVRLIAASVVRHSD